MLLRVVDLETSGLAPPEAAVCEIGYVDVLAHGRDMVGSPMDWHVVPTVWSHLVQPGHSIPPEVSAVHHIIDEDVFGAASWCEAVEGLLVARGAVSPPAALRGAALARLAHVEALIRAKCTDIRAISATKHGFPRHPLYAPADLPPLLWPESRKEAS